MPNTSYPMLSASNWWALRQKFIQTIPTSVTANSVSVLLDMKESSAAGNIIPYLKQVGIIDSDGKPTERAKLWRDDHDYPSVCKSIIEEVYPQDLRDIVIQEDNDKETIRRWFSRATGAGTSSVWKMVAFYLLLVEANPQKNATTTKKASTTKGVSKAPANGKNAKQKQQQQTQETGTIDKRDNAIAETHSNNPNQPSMNINLQIHISSEASVEQIDKIFESMAKHIYNHR